MNYKKRYILDIKRNIYVFGKNEKLFIKRISEEINKLSNVDYDYLVDTFGTPKEIAESCLDEYDETELKNKFNKMKIINYIFFVIAIIIFMIFLMLYDDYKKGNESFVEREETIIEKLS